MERKTEALRLEREAKDRELIEDQVAKRLTAEHAQLVAAESKKAREAAAAELQAKEAEAAELRAALLTNNAKLAEAQKQAESARSRTLGPWPPSFSGDGQRLEVRPSNPRRAWRSTAGRRRCGGRLHM